MILFMKISNMVRWLMSWASRLYYEECVSSLESMTSSGRDQID